MASPDASLSLGMAMRSFSWEEKGRKALPLYSQERGWGEFERSSPAIKNSLATRANIR
jgi:hypothetical protein